MAPGVRVDFDAPIDAVFDYLTDPVNRPAWQSSLRRVEILDVGPPHEGQRWIDVTRPGPRPQMSTTVLEPPHRWVERGVWRGITVEGELRFAEVPSGCEVTATATFVARGQWRAIVPLLVRTSGLAVAADLRRAATLLSTRGTGK